MYGTYRLNLYPKIIFPGLMVEILRKDNPSIQLHSTTVGFKASREERKDREAFMVAYFKSSDDSDSFYSRYRMKRELSDDELGGKERILLNAFCVSELLSIYVLSIQMTVLNDPQDAE